MLNLLRRYRDAETAMRSRVRAGHGHGREDILALRHLISADDGHGSAPRTWPRCCGWPTPPRARWWTAWSATATPERIPHPDDRRSVAVVPRRARQGGGPHHPAGHARADDRRWSTTCPLRSGTWWPTSCGG
ncbi:hypothetical protein QJS66_15540 [Kocuria rhizophila]|nr:hypothetical protein QJS66_15540 [Kocuria rhizophila]